MHLPIRVIPAILLLAGCQLSGAQPSCPFDETTMVPSLAQLGVKTTGGSQWSSVSLQLSQAVLVSDDMESPYLSQEETFPLSSTGYFLRALPLPSLTCKNLRLSLGTLTGVLSENGATRSVSINLPSSLTLAQNFSLDGNTRSVLLLNLDLGALVTTDASQSFSLPAEAITITATSHPANYSPEGFTSGWMDCAHYLSLAQGRVTQEDLADLKLRIRNNEPMLQGYGAIADLDNKALSQVSHAPSSGFTNLIKAVEGHTYVVRTRDGKYAKVYLAHLAKVQDQYGAWLEYYLQENGSSSFSR